MKRWLLVLLIVIPIAEIWILVEIGRLAGTLPTLLLLLASCLLGAWLMKREGRKAWTELQRQLQAGQPPGRTMLDGLCIVGGGILLLLPGFLSDIVGLTLLLPFTRPLYRGMMLAWLEKRMRGGGGFTITRR